MIEPSPDQAQHSPEDSLKDIAPALRELAAGVRAVPSEIKGELGKQTLVADTAYKAGWKDGAELGAIGTLILLAAAWCFGRAFRRQPQANDLWTKRKE